MDKDIHFFSLQKGDIHMLFGVNVDFKPALGAVNPECQALPLFGQPGIDVQPSCIVCIQACKTSDYGLPHASGIRRMDAFSCVALEIHQV